MSTPAALHSSDHAEHYTPPLIVDPARRVLGEIDLDPASCEAANEIVRARYFYSDSGLAREWGGRVFLNPPGGKLHTKTLKPIVSGPGLSGAAVWWAKLWSEWDQGRVQSAIFVCFSLNVFQNTQGLDVPPPQSFPFCVPRKRVAYEGPGARSGPPHPSAIVYVPPRVNEPDDFLTRFAAEFAPLGFVRL